MMIAAVDVDYRDPDAVAACVTFSSWSDARPSGEHVERVRNVAAYVSGRFYQRELPCIRAVLERAGVRPALVIVDGHVWLTGQGPGLGAHLSDAIGVPVIGVAKTEYAGAPSIEVLRGTSEKPLYVSAIGVDPAQAATWIRTMHGEHRIPTLLQRVDRLCREAA